MANKDALLAYKNAEVAKVFPLYGTEPLKGTVKEVDMKGKDSRRFRIVYEDGDSEWITLQELQSILVKDASKQEAPKSDKKRARSSKQTSEDAAAAPQSDAAATAAADQQQAHNKPKKQKQAKTSSQQQQQQAEQQQQGMPGPTSFTITAGAARASADKPAAAAGTSKVAAAAAAAGRGEQAGTPSKRAAAAAAAAAGVGPAGTPGRRGAAASGRGAASGGGASMSTADTQGMLANIHQNAAPIADKLSHDREIARMPYQGPGAAGLPAMSQVVIAGGLCYISLHSAPRPRHSTTPGKALNIAPSSSTGQPGSSSSIDYEAESVALLGELVRLLQHANIDKRWLVKVRVTLRSMQEGLPGFQAAWKAWAKRDELPVLTLVEGAGPFKASGVMLEATALAAPL